MSFVCVDIGASSTRYISNTAEINELPNYMVHLKGDETTDFLVESDKIEDCLEVKIKKNEPELRGPLKKEEEHGPDHFPANVLVGLMADKNRRGIERPSGETYKFMQRNNYISIVLACAMSKLRYGFNDEIDLYVAVPPTETMNVRTEKEFQGRLVGTFTLQFPKYNGGTTVDLTIRSVTVYAEAFMAVTSYLFDMSGRVKESSRKYLNGNILSLDIGASTTDVAVIKEGRLIDTSGRTYRYGGNTVMANLSQSLNNNGFATEYTVDMLTKAMAEGRIQSGNSYDMVGEYLESAKESLADNIVAPLGNHLKSLDIPLTSLNVVVVSGGGSMQSQYVDDNGAVQKTAEPMSYFITEKIRQYSQKTDVVNYGDDARYANIKGLFIRAKIEELKKQQAVAVSQTAPATPAAPAPVAQPAQATQPVAQTTQPAAQPVQQTAETVQAQTQAVQPAQTATVETVATTA